jgi:hypothetical protein
MNKLAPLSNTDAAPSEQFDRMDIHSNVVTPGECDGVFGLAAKG